MVEERIYYRYVGEHSQSQGHLGESRVHMALNRGRGRKGERERGGPGAVVMRPKGTKRGR